MDELIEEPGEGRDYQVADVQPIHIGTGTPLALKVRIGSEAQIVPLQTFYRVLAE